MDYNEVLEPPDGSNLKEAVRRYSIRSEHLVMRKSEQVKLVLPDFDGLVGSHTGEDEFPDIEST